MLHFGSLIIFCVKPMSMQQFPLSCCNAQLYSSIVWHWVFYGHVFLLWCFPLKGSVLYNHFAHGKLERSEGSSITEGICSKKFGSLLMLSVNYTM